ncbi:acetylxylan esterase [Coraliomargarita algicola]|uniref:Acetylxylan esterase n=1 Tax=Coraliomargarita algicola TaxID=3092156 RepID=A0ABZ0RKA1_9BACT|nr:acetylxylan esterase [Coraliomargarita sp. J2-16]WPJ95586.1 acetylxylan esterase [Coraliomargarita sp. J2-16]
MKNYLYSLILCLLAQIVSAQTYRFEIYQSHADGIYQAGEPIVFKVRMLEDGEAITDKGFRCILYHNRKEVAREDFFTADLVEYTTQLEAPGWCQLTVVGISAEGKPLYHEVGGRRQQALGYSGAVVDPLEMKPGLAEPDDFDAFWAQEKAKLQAIPLLAKRTLVPDVHASFQIEYVEVPVGSGFRPVNATLKIPANAQAKSLPIFVHVHGAGVHLPKTNLAWQPPVPKESSVKGPVIFMNLNAHGLPNDQPQEFYTALREGALKDYPYQNIDDPDRYYMKGVILRLMRALEFMKTLPEWDGQNVIVSGGSQGGAQALIAAGLDTDVSFIYADVPAMCDFGGPVVGHAPGWPRPYEGHEDGTYRLTLASPSQEQTVGVEDIVHLGYFDAANFACRIRAQAVLRTGGWDGVCPPTGVFAAYNNIPTENKSIQFAPQGGHTRGNYKADQEQDLALYIGDRKQPSISVE